MKFEEKTDNDGKSFYYFSVPPILKKFSNLNDNSYNMNKFSYSLMASDNETLIANKIRCGSERNDIL